MHYLSSIYVYVVLTSHSSLGISYGNNVLYDRYLPMDENENKPMVAIETRREKSGGCGRLGSLHPNIH